MVDRESMLYHVVFMKDESAKFLGHEFLREFFGISGQRRASIPKFYGASRLST